MIIATKYSFTAHNRTLEDHVKKNQTVFLYSRQIRNFGGVSTVHMSNEFLLPVFNLIFKLFCFMNSFTKKIQNYCVKKMEPYC